MTNRLAVHWPPRIGDDRRRWNWLYLQRRATLNAGDRVFIYETYASPDAKSGRRIIKRVRNPGVGSVVELVEVCTGELESGPGIEELVDGRKPNWRFVVRTRRVRHGNRVSLDKLRVALKNPRFCARIPGGLMRLKPKQFKAIEKLF